MKYLVLLLVLIGCGKHTYKDSIIDLADEQCREHEGMLFVSGDKKDMILVCNDGTIYR